MISTTPPTHRTLVLFRGFILRNSDVGAAALTLDLFLFRAVCGESHHLGLSPRGRLPAPACGCVDSRGVGGVARVRPRRARREPRRRSHHAPAGHHSGTRRDARGGPRRGRRRDSTCRGSRPLEAYGLAEAYEPNPRSVWGYVQGLTRLSQRTPWQDARFSARPGRQPSARHGQLTLAIVAVRAQPARPLLLIARRGLRPARAPARDRGRARGCLRSQSPGAQRRCVRCATPISSSTSTRRLDGRASHPFTR